MNQVGSHHPSRSLPTPGWWWIGLGVFAAGLCLALAASASQRAGAVDQPCPAQLTIDFSGLPAGTIIGEQYAGSGVHISGVANEGYPDALIVFDTNAPPTHDPDMAVDIGNIAIFANNLNDDNGDGLVDDPDENNFGGRAAFTFDQDVNIGSFLFIDKDHPPSDFAIAYDGAGNVLANVPIPQAGNGSVQTIAVNADGVRRFEIVYGDSGGFTGIEVACEQAATPTATAVEQTPVATPTATATPTASPTATAPSATATPTPTQPPPASATPTVAAVVASPAPPTAAVAAEAPAAHVPTAVLAAGSFPASGGAPSETGDRFSGAAALAGLALVVAGSFAWIVSGRLRATK